MSDERSTAARAPVALPEADNKPSASRREFLRSSARGMLYATVGIGLVSSVRLLFPRVSHAPPTSVALCKPEELSPGEVSERWKQSHRIIVVRDQGGFYALSAVCTHLGCIPDWQPGQRTFRCPCHGSGFHPDGKNFEGPAPRPLERLKITLDESGHIVVDTAVRFRQERGEWEERGAYLRHPAGEGDGAR